MCRKIPDSKADPALFGRIGIGPVDQEYVVKRHFAGLKRKHRRLAFINLHRDFLTPGQEIVGVKGVAMRDLFELLGIRNHPHGAVLGRALRERDPCGDDIGGIKSPIG